MKGADISSLAALKAQVEAGGEGYVRYARFNHNAQQTRMADEQQAELVADAEAMLIRVSRQSGDFGIDALHDAYYHGYLTGDGDIQPAVGMALRSIDMALTSSEVVEGDKATLREMKGRLGLAQEYMSSVIDEKGESGYNGKQGKAGSMEDAGVINVFALSTRFLNRMDPLWENAAKIEPIEGYQDIVCHGDTVSIVYRDANGNEINVSALEFAEILKSSPVYEGRPIRLIACEAGAGGSVVAQTVADYLGVEVMAPTDIVYVYTDGTIKIGRNNTGIWKRFKPGGDKL